MIEASIVNNLKPLVIPDVARQFSEGIAAGQQRQLHQQQQQMNALKIEQEQRANKEAADNLAEQEKGKQIYAESGGDRDKTISGAIAAGLSPKFVQGLQKHYADLDKEATEMDVKKQEVRKGINSQLLPLHDQAIQEAQADPNAFAQKWPQYVATALQIDPRNADHLDPSKVPTIQDLMMSRAAHQTIFDVDNRADQKRKEQKALEDAAKADREAKLGPVQQQSAELGVTEAQAKVEQVKREQYARENPDDEEAQVAALTAEQRSQLKQHAEMVAKLNTPAELAFKASDPKAPVETREAAKAALKILEQHAIASRPITNNTFAVPGLGNDQSLTGQAFMDQLEKTAPGTAAQIRGIAEGRISMPSMGSRGQGSPLRDAVMKFDPQFSEQRAQIRKAFTTGPDGRNIGALNTAAGHLDQFAEAADALKNGTFRPGNQVYNYLSQEFGSSAPTNFAGLKSAVSGELASALKGTATDQEIEQISKAIESKNSPEQLRDYVKTQMHVLGKKLQTYQERHQQQIPGDTVYSPILPSTKTVFDKYGVGGGGGPKKGDTKPLPDGHEATFDGTDWVVTK